MFAVPIIIELDKVINAPKSDSLIFKSSSFTFSLSNLQGTIPEVFCARAKEQRKKLYITIK